MKKTLLIALAFMLAGCASIPPDRLPITTEKREFTYDYTIPKKSQKELFKAARNYLATSYGDSKEVSRVEDEEQGTIIGKAITGWNLSIDSWMIPHIPCASNYSIIFIAKEGRARLQLTLVEGTPMQSCGWSSPPKRDYPQIVLQFNGLADGLGQALNGQAAIDQLKNF